MSEAVASRRRRKKVWSTGSSEAHAVLQGGRGRESPLYEVICPAVYVVRVFGLQPYDYPKDNRPPRLQVSNFNCVYSLFWASIYTWVVVYSLVRFSGLDRDKPVLGITENGKLIMNYLVGLIDIILTIKNRKKFIRIWNALIDFDETFQLGRYSDQEDGRLHRMFRQTKMWTWITLSVGCVSWSAINQLGMHAFDEPYMQNVGYMITYVGTCVAVMKFAGIVFLIGQRFGYLNELVAKQRIIMANSTRVDLTYVEAVVAKAERNYNILLSTSESLSRIYSCSLFFFLLNIFSHAVSNMYFFTIWTIVDPEYLKNPKVVLCLFIWLLVYLAQLLILHVACHYATLQASRMANVLLDWRRHVLRLGKHNSFSSTLHYLNRRLNFTAAGCFNVNLPLLTSTIGHLTTYLVILLQIPDSGA